MELNFVRNGTKIALVYGLLLASPALAGTIAQPKPADPLLDGGPTTACAAGADYAAGQDATGRPVPPADVDAGHIPVPTNIAIGLTANGGKVRPTASGRDGYVELDGQKLDRLVNPPACH